jgi:hypothetical protein
MTRKCATCGKTEDQRDLQMMAMNHAQNAGASSIRMTVGILPASAGMRCRFLL